MTDPVNRPVRLAGLAGVMALGLVLAGCSGDGGAGESPSVAPSATSVASESASSDGSSSASPSASPSGTYEPATETSPAKNVPVPEMPEAAKEPTEAGLEAAVEYWWETEYYLKASGQIGPMEEVSTADCKLCQSLSNRWSEAYELGGWAENEPAEVQVQFTNVDNGGLGGTGAILVSEAPGQMYMPDGEVATSGDGSSERPWAFSASFDESSGNWRLESLDAQG